MTGIKDQDPNIKYIRLFTVLSVIISLFARGVFAVNKTADDFDRLVDTGRFEEASAAVENTPSGAERHFLQAKLYFYEGRYGDAAAEMGKIEGLKDGKSERGALASYYAVLDRNTRDDKVFESEHFVFKAGGRDAVLAAYALEALEKIYASIGNGLGCFPPAKVLVEIHGSKRGFSLASTLGEDVLEKSGTVGICKFNRLMLLSPENLPLGYAWADTLCHEYTHFVVNRLSGGRCPLWLQEGIAKYYETSWRSSPPLYLTPSAKNALAAAKKHDNYITFKRMHPSLVFLKDQDEILRAFAEVSCSVDYMQQKYGPKVVAKLTGLMSESDEKQAFNSALGIREERFEKDFFSYLKGLSFEESPGAVPDKLSFEKVPEEEFIGADLRGQIRLGDRMRQIGKPEAAAVQYAKALELEPANPVVMLKIAKALSEAGDTAGAITQLKAAAEKNPNYVTVLEALGELYFRQGDADNAINVLLKANLINPFDPTLHYCLSRSYLAKNDAAKAVLEMRVLLILQPDDAETKLLLEKTERGLNK